MRKILLIVLLICMGLSFVNADIVSVLNDIDKLDDQYLHNDAKILIEATLDKAVTNAEKAELYWRLARATTYLGDIAEEAKKPKQEILGYFEKAEGFADKAISLDSQNPLAYFWKSASTGRWGQVKGILESLGKAKLMKDNLEKVITIDPDNADAFDVLGQLYELLPGPPISFGNMDFAISLSRKAVDNRQKLVASGKKKAPAYPFITHLANQLYNRNWNADNRKNNQKKKLEKYNATSSILEKNMYYEGAINIPSISDREEAYSLIRMVVSELEKIPARTRFQEKDLGYAKDYFKKWKL